MSLVDYLNSSDDSEKEETSESENCRSQPKTVIKRKDPVKITLPSLAEFEDEESKPVCKKIKMGKSGLLSMLPAPKYTATKTTSLVPQSVSKKKPPLAKNLSSSFPNTVPSSSINNDSEKYTARNSEEVVSGSDFFSLEDTEKLPPLPSDLNLSMKNIDVDSCKSSSFISNSSLSGQSLLYVDNYAGDNSNVNASQISDYGNATMSNDNSYIAPQPPSYYDEPPVASSSAADIMNEGFLRLHGKNRRGLEEVKLIDVHGDSLVSSATDWHTKSITEEKKLVHSRKKGGMPTQVQKRKHQITYLAFQAKERELDLKNQWAQNRLTKQQTQSKYGF